MHEQMHMQAVFVQWIHFQHLEFILCIDPLGGDDPIC